MQTLQHFMWRTSASILGSGVGPGVVIGPKTLIPPGSLGTSLLVSSLRQLAC